MALAGCDDIATLNTGAGGGGGAGAANALQNTTLALGAIALVPPPGYCIDKRSLRARFALMARCDTLGGTTTFGAPLAIITAAAVSQGAASSGAISPDNETVLERRQADTITLLRVRGTPPGPNMRDVFWRGVAPIGDQVLGLALYEPQDGPDLGAGAPDLLVQTMRNTQAQSAARTAARQDNSATTAAKPATN